MSRRLWVALCPLGAVHIVVLFAGFFSPYDPTEQDRSAPFAPPARIHFFDAQGRFHSRPFIEAGGVDCPLEFFVTGAPYSVVGIFEGRRHLFGVRGPARLFLLGSDADGRDQFSRFLFGGRVSLAAGLLATAISVCLGLALGAVSGFYGKATDAVIMRCTELFRALPWLYFLFAVRAFLPLHIAPQQAFLLVTGVIGLIGWARPARLVRGVALSAKESDYVLAARGFGASNLYLLRRHVLPQTYGVALTQATILLPQFILAEVTLSFVGLGVPEPAASWGTMLAALRHYHVLVLYWWMFIPGLLLIPVFLGYYELAVAVGGQEARQRW